MGNLSRIYCLVRGTCQKAKHEKTDIIGALVSNEVMQSP